MLPVVYPSSGMLSYSLCETIYLAEVSLVNPPVTKTGLLLTPSTVTLGAKLPVKLILIPFVSFTT